MPVYPCSICGKQIEMPWAWRKKREHVFCSDKCRWTPFIPKKCIVCGTTFLSAAGSASKAKYCSDTCFRAHCRDHEIHKKGKLVTKRCERCGKEFSVRSSVAKVQRFCSLACAGKTIGENHQGENSPVWKERVTLVCVYCGKEFETFPCRNDGRRKYCCRTHQVLGNLKRLASGARTDIEKTMADALRKNRVPFSEQVVMFDKFMVDFKLTDYPIIIQCDGTYWHDRPNVKTRDKGQDAYLTKAGYVVLRFNETQILKNTKGCIKTIKAAMRNPSQPPLINY